MPNKSSNTLYTIGYEGKELDDFITRLKAKGIDCVIDVRDMPVSRKKGFSKNVLSEILEKENIKYIHIKELGSPKDIRDKYKKDNDAVFFFKRFSEYIDTRKDVIERAYNYIVDSVCCLMCVERWPEECHRSVVATKIKERDGNGLMIINI